MGLDSTHNNLLAHFITWQRVHAQSKLILGYFSNEGRERVNDLQDNRRDCEELAWSGELHAVVHLLPVGQEASFALIWGLKGRPFDRVKKEVHALQQTHNNHNFRDINWRKLPGQDEKNTDFSLKF